MSFQAFVPMGLPRSYKYGKPASNQDIALDATRNRIRLSGANTLAPALEVLMGAAASQIGIEATGLAYFGTDAADGGINSQSQAIDGTAYFRARNSPALGELIHMIMNGTVAGDFWTTPSGVAASRMAGLLALASGGMGISTIGASSLGIGASLILGLEFVLTTGYLKVYRRFMERETTDLASADVITIPADGNVIPLTGSDAVENIVGIGWQAGSKAEFVAVGSGASFVHGIGNLIMQAGLDFNMEPGDMIGFEFDGTDWNELWRRTVTA